MRTSSRSVAVVLFDEVELLDVSTVASVLSSAGRKWNFRPFKIVAYAKASGVVETRSQLRIEARSAYSDALTAELLIVPGGYGARRALSDDATVDFVQRIGSSAERLFGIGNGVLLLARAGLTHDADVAVSSESTALLAELSPTSRPDVGARFRESGKLLTAESAGGAADAALHLVAKLLGKKQAEDVARSLGIAFSAGDASQVDIVERES